MEMLGIALIPALISHSLTVFIFKLFHELSP